MVPAQYFRQLRDIVPNLLQANDICLCQFDHFCRLGQGLPLRRTAATGIVGHDSDAAHFGECFVGLFARLFTRLLGFCV